MKKIKMGIISKILIFLFVFVSLFFLFPKSYSNAGTCGPQCSGNYDTSSCKYGYTCVGCGPNCNAAPTTTTSTTTTTAAGTTGCVLATDCPGCTTSCVGTKTPTNTCACQAAGGGGGGSTQPVVHYAVGDPSYCIAANGTCGGGNTDLMGKYCCAGTSCQHTYGEHGATNDWNCFPIPKAATTFKCNGGSCPTAIGNVATDPAGFVHDLFAVILGISGGIAVVLIIISGYKLMVSQGNSEKLQGAREQFTAAIVGLLFIILSLVILQVIGVDILKLPGFTP